MYRRGLSATLRKASLRQNKYPAQAIICPRCGRRSMVSLYMNRLKKRCRNCGYSK